MAVTPSNIVWGQLGMIDTFQARVVSDIYPTGTLLQDEKRNFKL